MQTKSPVQNDTAQSASGDLQSPGGVRRVLIAYDGSTGAIGAIEDLVRAGLPERVAALVVFVHETSCFGKPCRSSDASLAERDAVVQAAESTGRQLAEAARERLKTLFPFWQVEVAMVHDAPAGEILRKAALWQPDLLVMGAHGHSASARIPLGSVARRIALRAWFPVRIARSPRSTPERHPRVLVVVDGSAADEAVIALVAARSWPARTEIQILTVVDGHLSAATRDTKSYAAAWKNQHDGFADARACHVVDGFRNRLGAAGLAAETLIFEGEFSRRVVEHAAAWEADCLFIGETPSRRGARVPPDSIQFHVAACAHCTVEIARNPTLCVE